MTDSEIQGTINGYSDDQKAYHNENSDVKVYNKVYSSSITQSEMDEVDDIIIELDSKSDDDINSLNGGLNDYSKLSSRPC